MSDLNNFEGAVGNRALTGFRNNKVSPLIGFVVAVFLAGCSPNGDEHTDSADVPGGQTPTERMEEPAVSEAAAQPEPAVAEPPATPAENGPTAAPALSEPAATPQPPSAPLQPSAISEAESTNSQVLATTPAQPEPAAAQPPAATASQLPAIDEVIARNSDTLSAIPGVVSVNPADCDVGPCIQVTVTRRTQSMVSKLPASVEGYPVVVSERASGH
jgi:hypothetical protein